MPRLMVAFLTGLLFATGLVLARMTRPDVVLGFLDVAGDWNPALALVMLGAVVTFGLLYRVSVRRGRPLLAGTLVLPRRNDLDARLFAGTAVFGLGWGLVGVCPGPAVTRAGIGRLERHRLRARHGRRHQARGGRRWTSSTGPRSVHREPMRISPYLPACYNGRALTDPSSSERMGKIVPAGN